MKKLVVLLAVFMSAFVVAACGSSSDDEQITTETLAAAMDEVCTERNPDFDAMGTRGLNNPGMAVEFEASAEIRQSVVDGFRELNVDDEAQAELDKYIAASEKIIAQDKEVAKAAAADDTDAVNLAFATQSKAFEERDEIAGELGTEVCGQTVEIKVEPTGTAPPEDLVYAEPKNTIEAAADEYVAAAKAGNCKAVNANRHTDAGELEAENCEILKGQFKGAEVAGTEQYGPVGQAEIVSGEGVHYPTYFVEDLDGMLRYGGDAIHDSGGLRPAPDGNDAQETADAVFKALREGDVEAFNETLPDEESAFFVEGESLDSFSEGEFNEAFVSDVKDSGAAPIQLGLNSTFGFYFLEGSEYDWVMTLIHIPGSGADYRLSGYFPIPKPE